MKFCSKLFVTVLTLVVSLHYFCQVNDCADQLLQICHYTSPNTWDQFLSDKSVTYKLQVAPRIIQAKEQYSIHVEPSLNELYEKVHEKAIRPATVFVMKYYENFDAAPYKNCILKNVALIRHKFWFYYNISVKPVVLRISEKYGLCDKCGQVRSMLIPYCSKVHAIFESVKAQVGLKCICAKELSLIHI